VLNGPKAEIFIPLLLMKRLTLTGSTLRARDNGFKALVADEIARTVWPHVEAGRLKPVVDSVFALEDAAGAHALMDSGAHVGKIVLAVGQPRQ
jgi:NADPH:quinone reductase